MPLKAEVVFLSLKRHLISMKSRKGCHILKLCQLVEKNQMSILI